MSEEQETTKEVKPEENSETQESKPSENVTTGEEPNVEEEVVEGNWNLPDVKLEQVKVVTGEENEEVMWSCRAKLYRWRGNEWKERGLGDAKLLKDEAGKIRFLLRQEKTGKVVANHYVIAKDGMCTLTPNAGSDKIWVWSVLDCSDPDEHSVEQFGLKFGTNLSTYQRYKVGIGQRVINGLCALRLTNVSLVRYRDGSSVFEVACYPNKVRDWREGKECDINEVLQSDRIFSNVSKGQFARDVELLGTFGTLDFQTCARRILKEGTIQLGSKERKLMEQNFQKEVYNLTAVRVAPLEGKFFLTVDQIQDFAKRAHLIPKQKKGLPPKPYASLLAQKLVKAYPDQLGVWATKIALSIKPELKRQAMELLAKISAFGIHEEAVGDLLRIESYIHESEFPTVESWSIASNADKLDVIEWAAAVPYVKTDAATNVRQPSAQKAKAETSSGSETSDSDVSSSDSEELTTVPAASSILVDTVKRKPNLFEKLASDEEDEPGSAPSDEEDEETAKEQPKMVDFLQFDRKAQMQQAKLKEKAIRQKERRKKEKEKEKKHSAAVSIASYEQLPASASVNEGSKSSTWCPACQIDYAIACGQTIRQHAKTEWHVFNQKRLVRNQPPVSRSDFEDLSRDMKEGFLAIQH